MVKEDKHYQSITIRDELTLFFQYCFNSLQKQFPMTWVYWHIWTMLLDVSDSKYIYVIEVLMRIFITSVIEQNLTSMTLNQFPK